MGLPSREAEVQSDGNAAEACAEDLQKASLQNALSADRFETQKKLPG